ncbi:hypothetical protein ACFPM3_21260 [Streptomyces coeruleoprunus]|uniref:Uncharacterized protein n=1 Tax=Streptomyces coeruleoprunus TaxID=285563 RepID=A0ABV9XKH6_9ACTN
MSLPHDDALAAAMAAVAHAFAGMTAGPDETGCGRCFDERERTLLRTPDAPLPPDLVRRCAQKHPTHWTDQPAVLRRVLPQLVTLPAAGEPEPALTARGLAAAGRPLWPRDQARPVAAFLEAWWTWTPRTDSPPTAACDVFESCATSSSSATPWPARWEAETGPVARRHLDESVHHWREELASGTSPFVWWWGGEAAERSAWREVTDRLVLRRGD